MFNINGHDAAEDWSFTEMDEDKGQMSWQDVIDEIHSFRFEGDDPDMLEKFDANDQKFYVRK